MALPHEHVGSKISAKIKIYIYVFLLEQNYFVHFAMRHPVTMFIVYLCLMISFIKDTYIICKLFSAAIHEKSAVHFGKCQ